MRDYATDYVTSMLEGGVRALIYAGDISTLYLLLDGQQSFDQGSAVVWPRGYQLLT